MGDEKSPLERAMIWIQSQHRDVEAALSRWKEIGEELRLASEEREALSRQIQSTRAALEQSQRELAAAKKQGQQDLNLAEVRSEARFKDEIAALTKRASMELREANARCNEANARREQEREALSEQIQSTRAALEQSQRELAEARKQAEDGIAAAKKQGQQDLIAAEAVFEARSQGEISSLTKRASIELHEANARCHEANARYDDANARREQEREEARKEIQAQTRKITELEMQLSQTDSVLREAQSEAVYFRGENRKQGREAESARSRLAELLETLKAEREARAGDVGGFRREHAALQARIDELQQENRRLRISYPLEALIRSKERDIEKIRGSVDQALQGTPIHAEAAQAIELLERQREHLIQALEAETPAATAESSRQPEGSPVAGSRWN